MEVTGGSRYDEKIKVKKRQSDNDREVGGGVDRGRYRETGV